MRTDLASPPAHATPPVPASTSTPAAPADPAAFLAMATAEAVEHLFRYASRAGHVHPLQHLLQRYRAGERA